MKMKQYIKLFPVLALTAAVAASCADDEILPFEVEKPESLVQYEAQYGYLNNYDAMKSYVDRQASPNFHLGLAIGANDFNDRGIVYQLVCENFDEMTAGNEMKYASIVNEEGEMNFATVEDFVETAKAAGVTIYGHTLAWHSQQNNNYLNGLIADKVILPDPEDQNHYLLLHQDAKANPWDGQVYYTLAIPLANDTEHTLSFRAKASQEFNFQFWTMNAQSQDVTVNGGTSIAADWTDYSFTFVPTGDVNAIKLVVGDLAGDFCIDDMSLIATGSDENLIANGDFEDENLANWTKYSWHAVTYTWVAEQISAGGGDGGYCLTLTNSTMQSANYGAQAWYQFSSPLKAGTSYTFTCMAKATSDYANLAPFLQSTTAGDQSYPAGFPVGTTWKECTTSFTPDKDVYDKFTFNFGDFVGTIYIDDVKIVETGSATNLVANGDFEEANINGWSSWNGYEALSEDGQGYSSGSTVIEMDPQLKKDTLTWAMNNWIAGMMEACEGYVTSWDAVNEAISGADGDGDGWYDLQSAENGDPANNFYWQDYLGNEDYVPIVTQAAVKYFAEYGGNPADLKLFINDYNLESWWDNNKKLESLIHWIEVWESKGAKIDGIGTQMHVSLILNENDQKAQEASIVRMFELMAATGKLVKISELDMGITEKAFGDGIKTEDVTYEQQQKMADFYQFIIQKYFEIIPPAQQYGITQWCATDSPADSGWRGGEPVGLWDLEYRRKPTYAGFANGLAGQVIVQPPYAAGETPDTPEEETPAE